MNIDTLRKADGTYHRADFRHVRRMFLNEQGATHLQVDSNVIAVRPGEQLVDGERVRGWTVDRCPNGIRGSSKFFNANEMSRAIRACLVFLNGQAHSFTAGDSTSWTANQGERDASVLAVIGDEVLIEYEMPGTTNGRSTSALVLCRGLGRTLTSIRNYPHAKLPQKWVDAIHEQGWASLWIGLGQRSSEPVPLAEKR